MKTVGDKFPAFSLPGIDENNEFVQVDIHESYTPHKKDWSVVYFYPKDFTFVCPTEIIAFSVRSDEFRAINCEVVACSTDSHFSHLAWYVQQ